MNWYSLERNARWHYQDLLNEACLSRQSTDAGSRQRRYWTRTPSQPSPFELEKLRVIDSAILVLAEAAEQNPSCGRDAAAP
ncbi:MAG: hypothetical protein ACRDVC_01555 [Acidimicrobiales bacterium]